ncbi:hypothetical protein [Streptomyces sp. SID8352]|uniref:hypothetical protein n=1 Tax=Streptomyces sp. SID8352 TaxID=2690338 RepID=UPI00137071BC|nr:hypothetical protein [Streptomyces sp. SID8352]MYU20758.1 hypothetical protein [Streptomyces sp. SID8352]
MSTSLQIPQVQHLSVLDRHAARERNELNYASTVTYHGLPDSRHIAVQATEDAVLVTATDIDVLGEWLYVQGGSITTVNLPSGQTVWTLHTKTWTDSPVKFPEVPVHLSVVLPTGEQVMHEIASAVAA